jgi:hypothetical protein
VERIANILKECGAETNIAQHAEGIGVQSSLLLVFANHIDRGRVHSLFPCRLEWWSFWTGGKCHVSSVDVLEIHGVLTIIPPIRHQLRGLKALKLETKQSAL